MTRKRTTLILVGVALLVGVTAALSALRGLGGLAPDPDVPTFEVERIDFVRRVRAEGNLEAAEATVLTPPPSSRGPVKIAWLAPDGSRVAADEVVIRFDPTEMEQNLAEGKSERDKTDSRMVQKEVRKEGSIRNLERDAEFAAVQVDYAREFQSKDADVFSRNQIIESEIDEKLATERQSHAEEVRGITSDLAGVEMDLLTIERRKAELKIEEAETGLQDLEVRAPHEGIFVLKEIWGDLPEVGSMVWRGNPLAEIPQLDVMEAEVFVLEADAGGLEEGLSAKVTLDAHPDRVYEAKVKKVDALAKPRFRRNPVQYFAVTLELDRTDQDVMKPGQRVEAELTLDERQSALAIPRQAVIQLDDENVVYVRRGAEFEPNPVKLGPAALGLVVIEEGVEEGDLIALRDPTRPAETISGGEGSGQAGGSGPSAGGGL